ncbi:hypothetical protein ADN00_07230 [Ornatilinea apprima]|uniref:Uncharacterized protein n=1 Tax=Ornatilinea apprima TaxID=1134406 RepID=A0A0P6XT20_9CHLR|nr:hypothetical protein ADN00_07230 [Ornatilinea apprima]
MGVIIINDLLTEMFTDVQVWIIMPDEQAGAWDRVSFHVYLLPVLQAKSCQWAARQAASTKKEGMEEVFNGIGA